jgi:hypothetical protein
VLVDGVVDFDWLVSGITVTESLSTAVPSCFVMVLSSLSEVANVVSLLLHATNKTISNSPKPFFIKETACIKNVLGV